MRESDIDARKIPNMIAQRDQWVAAIREVLTTDQTAPSPSKVWDMLKDGYDAAKVEQDGMAMLLNLLALTGLSLVVESIHEREGECDGR